MNKDHSTGISIVIAAIVGPPFIDEYFESIWEQAHVLAAEVIVVPCGTAEYASRLGDKFPWVQVIHRGDRATVPELPRCGVEAAQGAIVAIIEQHCGDRRCSRRSDRLLRRPARAAPVTPGVLVLRNAADIFRKRRLIGAWIKSLPASVALTLAWSCGEFTGYVAGPVRGSWDETRAGHSQAAP